MKKSKTHSAAEFLEEDSVWWCDECDSESMDFELFEEAGEVEDCLIRGAYREKQKAVQEVEDLVAWADVERAKNWIASTKKMNTSMEKMSKAAESAAEKMDYFNEAMKAVTEAENRSYYRIRGAMWPERSENRRTEISDE